MLVDYEEILRSTHFEYLPGFFSNDLPSTYSRTVLCVNWWTVRPVPFWSLAFRVVKPSLLGLKE